MMNFQTLNTEVTWAMLQQPVHSSSSMPADYLRLLAALDGDWTIAEATHLLSTGRSDGRGYLLTLIHKNKPLVREMVVGQSLQIDALLEYEGVPAAI